MNLTGEQLVEQKHPSQTSEDGIRDESDQPFVLLSVLQTRQGRARSDPDDFG